LSKDKYLDHTGQHTATLASFRHCAIFVARIDGDRSPGSVSESRQQSHRRRTIFGRIERAKPRHANEIKSRVVTRLYHILRVRETIALVCTLSRVVNTLAAWARPIRLHLHCVNQAPMARPSTIEVQCASQ